MKKLLNSLIILSAAYPAFSADYSVSNATDTLSAAPYLDAAYSTGGNRLLWKANGTNGTLVRGLKDYYIKAADGATYSYTTIYNSGSGGKYNNMVMAFENGATVNFSDATVMAFNYNVVSLVQSLYKFEAISGASGTLNFTYAGDVTLNLTYNAVNEVDRGVIFGSDITVKADRSLIVANTPYATNPITPKFEVYGTLNLGSGSYVGNLTTNYTATVIGGTLNIGTADLTTAGGTYTMNHDAVTFASGAQVNIGTKIIANYTDFTIASGATVKADRIELYGSTFTSNGSIVSKTSGSSPVLAVTASSTISGGTYSGVVLSGAGGTASIAGSLEFSKYSGAGGSLSIASGNSLTVGDSSANGVFANDNGNVVVGGSLLIYSKGASHASTSLVGNMTVDGGTLTEITGATSYGLAVVTGKTLSLKNYASATVISTTGSNYFGINGGTVNVDATSNINANGIAISATGALNLSSSANLVGVSSILVKDITTAATITLTAGSDVYELGSMQFLRNAMTDIKLGGAEMHLTEVIAYSNRETTAYLTFRDFAAGLVKIDGLTTEMISGGTFTIGTDTSKVQTLTLEAYDVLGNLLAGTWSIDADGYLFNSALIPEPAEWAAIFGILALCFTIWRKKK